MPNAQSSPLLEVINIKKYFPVRSGLFLRHTGDIHAVDDVSFNLGYGEILGLVGESGCGKSTLGRTIIKIYKPTSGKINFNGRDISHLNRAELREVRRNMTMVFQDPFSSLNPRMTVSKILDTPLRVHKFGKKKDRDKRVNELLQKVGLGFWAQDRYPHEFSGGQRQRIAIARALALRPQLVIADEPVSALDVSVQSQILNLIKDLQEEFGIAFLFIAHNLAVVKHISNRIAVMYLGKIVEMTEREELFRRPLHPYTQALIDANPAPGGGRKRKRKALKGDVPSPIAPPMGCHFHPRCPVAEEKCRDVVPVLKNVGTQEVPHWVSCHLL